MSDDPLADAIADAPDPDAPAKAAPSAAPTPAPAGGVAPRGGPLRGQRLTPPAGPPPGGEPGHGPTAPEPDLSLGEALHQAGKNLLPSAASNISNTLHALAPWNWGQDISGLNQLGVGLESKLGLIDRGNAAEQAKDEAAINAVGKMYGDRYGSWQGFKRTLANDPLAIGSDVATLATLPLGGEGMLAKVPDAAEAALMAGAGAARQGGALSNALLSTAVHVPGAMRAAGRIAKPALGAAQWADPAYAASQIVGKGVNLGRTVARVPWVGKALRGTVGAGVGNVVGGFVPFVGHTGGTIIGEHVGEAMFPSHPGPYTPGWLSKGAQAGSKVLPPFGTVGGTEPMSPAQQAQQPGAAPPPGPAGGQGSGDPLADAIADSGLADRAEAATPAPTPSSGLQGAPPTPPSGIKAVIRQAEGGFNQPVGHQPGGGSSARGAYQMIDSTYANNLRKYHPEIARGMSDADIRAFRNTPQGWALNETMGGQMVEDEISRLRQEGIVPTADSVGTLHMLGNTHLLHADPNTPIEQVTTGGQRRANAGIFSRIRTVGDFLNWMRHRNDRAAAQLPGPAYAAAGGRVGRADGGNVVDMTEALMRRAEAHHKATQQDTKPLLGLSDDTVAQALRVAQRGI